MNRFHLIRKHRYQEEGGEGTESIPAKVEGGEGAGNAGGEGTKPSDAEAKLLKEVMKRKGNEERLASQVSDMQAQLAKFDGIDTDLFKTLVTEKNERERTELERRGEFDRVKGQMIEQHTTELTGVRSGFETQVSQLTNDLNAAKGLITELTIGRSFSDSGFVRDSLALPPAKARVVYGSHFEVQGDRVVAFDKPAGAQGRTMLVDAKGEALGFDGAIEKIVQADPDHERLVLSKVKPGAGSSTDTQGKVAVKVGNGRDRISAAIVNGGLSLPT